MILERTVLILGAGASVPYGFLTGRGLLFEICDGIHASDHATTSLTPLGDALFACGFNEEHQLRFRNALLLSNQPSVDAFLEIPENREDFLDIGKAAIAAALISHEEERKLRRTRDLRWFEYLFNQMLVTGRDFRGNKLSFVTFNYDRSIEQLLHSSLTHSYGYDDDAVREVLTEIPVIHVYGELGKLPWQCGDGRPYEPVVTPQTIAKSTDSMLIMHEGTETSDEFERARRLLQEAQRICFLGFGYLETNLVRLFGSGPPPSGLDIPRGVRKYGTTFGLGQVERTRVKRQVSGNATLGSAILGRRDQACLGFLREEVPLS